MRLSFLRSARRRLLIRFRTGPSDTSDDAAAVAAIGFCVCVFWFKKGTTERGGFVEREREKAAREKKSESGKKREREMCEPKWGVWVGGN